MGFSVSTSAAVVFVGLFIALSTIHTVTNNTYEQVAEDQQNAQSDRLEIRKTSINISSSEVLDVGLDTCGIEIHANNTGKSTLFVNDTDLLIDGTYRTDWQSDAKVDGDASTNLWAPEEQLNISLDSGLFTSPPDRVKLVTGSGVADLDTTVTGGSLLC